MSGTLKTKPSKLKAATSRPTAPGAVGPTPADARAIGRMLLHWFTTHRRALPWRGVADPYAVWVSEMMLQQTQVSTVIPYFRRWMARFPDIAALARAQEDEVLHAWQGLGYYSRARNLRRAAQTMMTEHAGRVPDDVATLRALPGIGPYSAGAIASIAFGRQEPLVDGNVIRVLSRLYAVRGDPNRSDTKQVIWSLARALVPKATPGDFNQALMELGATVCTPQKPRCEACPLSSRCAALAQGVVVELPELPARGKPTQVHMVAAIVSRGERVLVVKLASDATRWASMWLFPQAEVSADEAPATALNRALKDSVGLSATPAGLVCVIRHTVTRFRITLEAYRARSPNGTARARSVAELAWHVPEALTDLAMPKAHRAIAAHLSSER